MAVPENFPLMLDDTGIGRMTYQLAKGLTGAQTILTAAQVSQALRDVSFVESNVDVLDVESFAAIELQAWGVASDTNTATLNLYGWQAGGPGQHLGTLDLTFGNFTSAASSGFHQSANTHKSIKDEFLAATAYRGCDIYTQTADYYDAITVFSGEADFPSHCVLSFATLQCKYLVLLVTAMTGTSLGCIFRPLAHKGGFISPDGV